ncbi:carboxypeptidase-like regulatory domain-containing protein [Ornithinimicrobium cerasi]|uniref:Carboxypeptidase regulatory-like domain-containing protein n=1 Tax=Ornithinimicrobium cerasi TaxID=2248773 RepID=A0A285VEL7_9MICO|nr:carboxypeptidase-like regulatory domain-containing protein [Ornithinimicrobium cerasi]SOC52542.1 hypothetical protein SAMN05421879_101658 [Ornithinimicrobium cerasi]
MTGTETWLEPFDGTDATILRELREVVARLDPCPADLTERISFALTVQALQAEVAELTSQPELVSRGFADDPAEATTVTFSTESVSIMVTVTPEGRDRARLDGWLTCGAASVGLDLDGGGTRTVEADEDGRFVLSDLPRGGARLTVHPPGGRPVITPQFTL